MYVAHKIPLKTIWFFGKKNIIRSLIISSIVSCVFFFLGWEMLAIPFLPVATIGTAVAFYVGFKNNQAYDRLWEARKLWGGITNISRILSASVLSLIKDKAKYEAFLMAHIAYINILRLQLRRTIPWATGKEGYHQEIVSEADEIKEFDHTVEKYFAYLQPEYNAKKLRSKGNIALHILKYQFEFVTKLKRSKELDDYEHSDLTKMLAELYNLQGGCERIKTTPLFRQFSLFSRIFVELFVFLLPFALVNEMDKLGAYGIWFTIPFTTLISWVFMTMEQVGETSENPFDNGINDIPLSAICRNIEIDMLEMLDESDLPQKIQPNNNILL